MSRNYDYQTIPVRIPKKYVKMIDDDARRSFRSRAQLIRDRLIADFVRDKNGEREE